MDTNTPSIYEQMVAVVAANHVEQLSMYQRIVPAINVLRERLRERLREAIGPHEQQVPSYQAWWRDPKPRLVLDGDFDVLVFRLPGGQSTGSVSFDLAAVLSNNSRLTEAITVSLGSFVNYTPRVFDMEVARHVAAEEYVKITWHRPAKHEQAVEVDDTVLFGHCPVLDYQIRHCPQEPKPYLVTSQFGGFVRNSAKCESFELAVQLCYLAQDTVILHAKKIGGLINLAGYVSRR